MMQLDDYKAKKMMCKIKKFLLYSVLVMSIPYVESSENFNLEQIQVLQNRFQETKMAPYIVCNVPGMLKKVLNGVDPKEKNRIIETEKKDYFTLFRIAAENFYWDIVWEFVKDLSNELLFDFLKQSDAFKQTVFMNIATGKLLEPILDKLTVDQ